MHQKSGVIYTTMVCNLSCPRCFLNVRTPADRANATLDWCGFLDIIRVIHQHGVHFDLLTLTGGEPTIWPHLTEAIDLLKERRIAKKIRVATNGVDRNIEDYGAADQVRVSHYGAINRADIQRLKKQGGKRVEVGCVVHLKWPFEGTAAIPVNDLLPADCGCVGLTYVTDKVFPCAFAAAMGEGAFPLNTDPSIVMDKMLYQKTCRTCISNRKLKSRFLTPLTAEFGIWDSAITKTISLPTKAQWIRKVYRTVRHAIGNPK